jgi:3-deoxy-D-manno-octulosonic-acid transferase
VGPHYANFRSITEDLIAHEAIRIATREELAIALIDVLSDRDEAAALGARAKQVFDAHAGATARAVDAIQELIAKVDLRR